MGNFNSDGKMPFRPASQALTVPGRNQNLKEELGCHNLFSLHTYIHTYTHTHIHTHIHTYIWCHNLVSLHMSVHVHAWCTNKHIHMHACIDTHPHMHMHTQTKEIHQNSNTKKTKHSVKKQSNLCIHT